MAKNSGNRGNGNGGGAWWAAVVALIAAIIEKYGKEILVWAVEKLSKMWRPYFTGRTVLVLGDKQTGKTSLLLFMEHGSPHEKKDGKQTPPNPTSGVVITDKKYKAPEGNMHVQRDVAGDRDFRSLWRDLIQQLSPEGVIYMIDGRKSPAALREAVAEMFHDFLDFCDPELRRPHTVHIFLNFADVWMTSEKLAREKSRLVLELYDEFAAGKRHLAEIQIEVSPTSLNPLDCDWSQATAALHKFGSALVGKSGHGK